MALIFQSSRSVVAAGGGGSGFTPQSGITFSGTFADGQSVTFGRAAGGFGTKTNVKPLWYFPFESDLNPHATLSRNTGSLNPDPSAAFQTSVKPVGSAGAARVRACTRQVNNTIYGQDHAPLIFLNPAILTTNKMYVFVKRYYALAGRPLTGAAVRLESKALRVWTSGTVAPDTYIGLGPEGGASYTEGVTDPRATVSGSSISVFHNQSESQDVWRTYEHFLQCSSDTLTNDGIWNCARRGQLYHDFLSRWKTLAPTGNREIFFDEYSNSDGDSLDYFSCIYIDDSPLRVWISDETSYDQNIHISDVSPPVIIREICIPTAWSDTSVTVTMRQGSHASMVGKAAYLGTDLYSAIKLGVGT